MYYTSNIMVRVLESVCTKLRTVRSRLENPQLRGIASRMLSEGPKYLNVSEHNRIVHVMVTSPPDARDGLLTSLRRMGSLARSAASCLVV